MEIADKVSNSELYLYEDYGHAVYEEAKDFNEKVLKYLKPSNSGTFLAAVRQAVSTVAGSSRQPSSLRHTKEISV